MSLSYSTLMKVTKGGGDGGGSGGGGRGDVIVKGFLKGFFLKKLMKI